MADGTAAATETTNNNKGSSSKINIILMLLVVVNTAIVGSVAFMVYQAKQKEAAEPGVEAVVRGELNSQKQEAEIEANKIKPLIPLESFVINLSGSRGRRVAKIGVELELPNLEAKKEIDRRQAQIRDTIIMIISSKTYENISTSEGKEALRNEIRNTINPALAEENKITNIYFTDFIYN